MPSILLKSLIFILITAKIQSGVKATKRTSWSVCWPSIRKLIWWGKEKEDTDCCISLISLHHPPNHENVSTCNCCYAMKPARYASQLTITTLISTPPTMLPGSLLRDNTKVTLPSSLPAKKTRYATQNSTWYTVFLTSTFVILTYKNCNILSNI